MDAAPATPDPDSQTLVTTVRRSPQQSDVEDRSANTRIRRPGSIRWHIATLTATVKSHRCRWAWLFGTLRPPWPAAATLQSDWRRGDTLRGRPEQRILLSVSDRLLSAFAAAPSGPRRPPTHRPPAGHPQAARRPPVEWVAGGPRPCDGQHSAVPTVAGAGLTG